jgi:hypothetical protein
MTSWLTSHRHLTQRSDKGECRMHQTSSGTGTLEKPDRHTGHDALLKPMPRNPMAPSLAKSWTVLSDKGSGYMGAIVYAAM